MDYFQENFGKSKGFVLSDLLMHLGGDYWALNAIYQFKAFLPVLPQTPHPRRQRSVKVDRTIFRHVGELIGKGIKRGIRLLKRLLRWFKNTAKVIWRDLKEIYPVMSREIRFFFSQR